MRFPRYLGALAIVTVMSVSSFMVPRLASAHRTTAPAGTLTAAFHDDFSTLDPAIGYDPFSWTGEHAIFSTLVGYANKSGRAGTQLVPDLATALPKISFGGRWYRVTLRPNVHFAPPVKRVVTARDVQYSIERALAKGTAGPMYKSPFWSPLSGTAAFWNGTAHHIRGIHILGKYTIQFRLDAPDLAFENILALPFASVIPRERVVAYGKHFSDHVVGTGPYRLISWKHGRQMVLARNPLYFHSGTPKVPQVVIQFGVDEHLQILRAQKGQLDLPGNLVTSTDYLALRRSQYARQLTSTRDIGVWYLAMNMQMAPFAGNLHLRRAFNRAINKTHILRLVNGRGIRMNGILPPPMPGANRTFKAYDYSPSAASAELKSAGYKPGQLHLSMLFIESPDTDRVADAVQADLAKIGVQLTLKPVSADTAYNTVYTPGKSVFTLFHWGQDYPDPSDFFDPILTCSATSNAAFYCNKTVDKLADAARSDTNTAHRFATYRRMERLVMNDAPWVPLYDDVFYDFHGPRVRNFYVHPVWPFVYDQYSLGK